MMRTWEKAQFILLEQVGNRSMWLSSKGDNEADIRGKNTELVFCPKRIDKRGS